MKNKTILLFIFGIFFTCNESILAQKQDPVTVAYIKRFVKVAQGEEKYSEIPASLFLAQGILESNSGKSQLVKKNKNHFNRKCFSKPSKNIDPCSKFGSRDNEDYIIFKTDWESWRTQSDYLLHVHMPLAFHCNTSPQWAYGLEVRLKRPNYATELIDIITQYDLEQYDVYTTRIKSTIVIK